MQDTYNQKTLERIQSCLNLFNSITGHENFECNIQPVGMNKSSFKFYLTCKKCNEILIKTYKSLSSYETESRDIVCTSCKEKEVIYNLNLDLVEHGSSYKVVKLFTAVNSRTKSKPYYDTKVLIECDKCNKEEVYFYSYLDTLLHKKCECEKREQNRRDILSNYQNLEVLYEVEYPIIRKSSVICKCKHCKYSFKLNAQSLYENKTKNIECPNCVILGKIIEYNELIKQFYQDDDVYVYDFVPKHITKSYPYVFLSINGEKYVQHEYDFLKRNKPKPIKDKRLILDLDSANNRVHIYNPTLNLLEYTGVKESAEVKCNRCNSIFTINNAGYILNKYYPCPKCKELHKASSLELILMSILDDLNITYNREMTFRESNPDSTKRIDFEINLNKIKLNVEAQGEQHFVDKGLEPLEVIQSRDLRKFLYHINNLIPLAYTKYDWSYTKTYDYIEESIAKAKELQRMKNHYERLLEFDVFPTEQQYMSQCTKAYKAQGEYLKSYYRFMNESLQISYYLKSMLPDEYKFLLSEDDIDTYVDTLINTWISELPTDYQSLQSPENSNSEEIQQF